MRSGRAQWRPSCPSLVGLDRAADLRRSARVASNPRYAHSLALGGSRVDGDPLSPIPVAVNPSTAKDLRGNSEGHLRSALARLCASDYWHSRPLGLAHPPARLEQRVPAEHIGKALPDVTTQQPCSSNLRVGKASPFVMLRCPPAIPTRAKGIATAPLSCARPAVEIGKAALQGRPCARTFVLACSRQCLCNADAALLCILFCVILSRAFAGGCSGA